jgi:hypothetical protein
MISKRVLMHKINKLIIGSLGALLSFFLAAMSHAEQVPPTAAQRGPVIELESRVTGNREQPQVFYLVPWQTPESPTLEYDPLSSQLQQVFGHLEREELRRQLDRPSLKQGQVQTP